MDPDLIYDMTLPIIRGETSVVMGSHFLKKSYSLPMSKFMKLGDAILRYLNIVSTGYWDITDPQTGFILFKGEILKKLDLSKWILNFILRIPFSVP